MYADQFSDSSGRRCAGIGCRFHSAHVAAHKNRHISSSDVFLPQQLDISGLHHRVSSLHGANEAFRLDHSESF
jgi:hypothetical protein